MAVAAGGTNLQTCVCADKCLPLQRAANQIDYGVWQVREISQRLVLDLAVFAVAAAQQMGAIDLAVVLAIGCDYVR